MCLYTFQSNIIVRTNSLFVCLCDVERESVKWVCACVWVRVYGCVCVCVGVGVGVYPQSHVYELVAHNAIVRSHTSLEWKTNWLEMVCIVVFCTPHSSFSFFPPLDFSFVCLSSYNFFSIRLVYFEILCYFLLFLNCFGLNISFFCLSFILSYSFAILSHSSLHIYLSIFHREAVYSLSSLNFHSFFSFSHFTVKFRNIISSHLLISQIII